jgi:hypothetical protein
MLRPINPQSIAYLIEPTEAQLDVIPTAPSQPASASTPAASTAQARAAARRRLGEAGDQARGRIEDSPPVESANIDKNIFASIHGVLAAEGFAPKDLNSHERYRMLLTLNRERSEPWPDTAIQVVAGIDTAHAAAIQKEENLANNPEKRTAFAKMAPKNLSQLGESPGPTSPVKRGALYTEAGSPAKSQKVRETYVHSSRIDSQVVAAIKAALEESGMNIEATSATKRYKAARKMASDHGKQWSDLDMQAFAQISYSGASRVRNTAGNVTPRTKEIKDLIAHSEELSTRLNQYSFAKDKFKLLIDHYAELGQEVHAPSAAHAVGMKPQRNFNTHASIADSDPQVVKEIREDLEAEGFNVETMSANKRYKAALEMANDHAKQWSDLNMQVFAQISYSAASRVRKTKGDVTPRTQQVKNLIAQSTELSTRLDQQLTLQDKFKIVMNHYAGREEEVNAPSVALAVGMVPTGVSRVLKASKPLTQAAQEIRTQVKVNITGKQFYRAALELNKQRMDAGQPAWLDKDMIAAAKIRSDMAGHVRREREPLSPGTEAIKTIIGQDSALTAELALIQTPVAKLHAMEEYQLKHHIELNPRSVAKAVGVAYGEITRALNTYKPLTQAALEIRSEVPAIAPNQKHFIEILNTNERRIASGKPAWLEADMIAAAKIKIDYAQQILEREVFPSDQLLKVTVKNEIATSIIIPRLEEVNLDMSRTAFYPEIGDLTGEGVSWVTHFDLGTKAIVHDMKPNPGMDNVFPIRDPRNPGLPHPSYADARGSIGQSRVGEVAIGRGFITSLKELAKEDRSKPLSERRLNLSDTQVRSAIDRIQENVKRELNRTLLNQAQARPVVSARVLTDADVLPHEKPLIGQHGLFVHPKLPAVDRPTLSNGRILGIYAGARLETDEDYDVNKATYGEEEFARYSLATAISAVTYSPLGGANSMAFANTALDPDSDEPAYDEGRLNTTFLPFSVQMTGHDGTARKEAVLALVAFDNLEDQVLVDYGDAYLEQFTKSHGPAMKQETDSE